MMCPSHEGVRARAQITRDDVLHVVTQTAVDVRRNYESVAPPPRSHTQKQRVERESCAQPPVERLQTEIDGLRTAMLSRAVIEQAKGMLMLRHRCDEDVAFRILLKTSQRLQLKLRDVAQHVVAWGSCSGAG